MTPLNTLILTRVKGHLVAVLILSIIAGIVSVLLHSPLNIPAPSYLLLDRHEQFIAEISLEQAEKLGYWPLEQVPARVAAATLALEDKRFWSHVGVDPMAVMRAAVQNWRHGQRVSGASTIAMQLARMQQPDAGRDYSRKLFEAFLALVYTLRDGREAVLKNYLKTVPYGNRIHGIAYAARRYLDKPVADLSWAEIAFLSAIPQAPSTMNPFRVNGRIRAIIRAERILAALKIQQLLDEAEYELALVQLRAIGVPSFSPRLDANLHGVMKIKQVLTQYPQPVQQAEAQRIITTLDNALQSKITALTRQALVQWHDQGAGNAAVIVVEQPNQVRAWIGSADYFDTQQAGAIDFTQVKRSPGSTLKPFIFAQAFERGLIHSGTVLDDLYPGADGILNADRAYLGPLLPRQALSNSRNVPVVNLLRDIGLHEGYYFFHELGLHANLLPAEEYGLGMAVGTLPVSLAQLVQAYSVFTQEGVWGPLQFYKNQPIAAAKKVLSLPTARLINLFLADPAARLPVFPRMGNTEFAFPVAVKTGTSSAYRDAWTIAYSQRYLVGVWVGHADARSMQELTGSRSAAWLAQSIMLDLHTQESQGFADLDFPSPPGYQLRPICATTAKLASPACDRVLQEWFAPGLEPKATPENQTVVTVVDSRTGAIARAETPRQYRKTKLGMALAARYGEWATARGIPVISAGLTAPHVKILSPTAGLRMIRDPGAPAGKSSVALRVVVDPPVQAVLWYIDGQPYQLTPFPYLTHWTLQPGEHTVQARIPYTQQHSAVVKFWVE